jgi:hypothetical protein
VFEHSDSYRAMLAAAPTAPTLTAPVDAVAGEPVAKPKPPGHVDLGSIKVDYPSAEWMARAEEYVKRVAGRMQEAIDAAAEHGRDDYRVQQASAGAWLAATDLRQMAIERGIELIPPRAASVSTPAVREHVLQLMKDRNVGEPVLCTWAGCREVWKHVLATPPRSGSETTE